MRRLAILGGSSPFTLALIDALRERSGELGQLDLMLAGRDLRALELVGGAARARVADLEWTVQTTRSMDEALAGADDVVQQIRFGGLEGRAQDEGLARATGCPADETLGPAALRRALCISGPIRDLAAQLAQHAGGARIWNLTNPLSLTTSLLAENGLDVTGICELPRTTARRAAAVLDVPEAAIDWDVVGLNHRAFLVRLVAGDRDLLEELTESGRAVPGTTAEVVRELGAIPTKYHELARGGPGASGRAAKLGDLHATLLDELAERPGEWPRSLGDRVTDWYEEALVPCLAAAASSRGERLVVDRVDADGVTREYRGSIAVGGVAPRIEIDMPNPVADWVSRFENHERALLRLLERPSTPRLREVVELDPVIPESARDEVVRTLLRDESLEKCFQ